MLTVAVQNEGMGKWGPGGWRPKKSLPPGRTPLEGISPLCSFPNVPGSTQGPQNPPVTGSSSPLLSRISTSLSRTGVPEQLKQTSSHLGLSKKKTDFTAPFTLSGSGRILPGQEFPSHSKHHARLGYWDPLRSKRPSRVQHTVSWRPGRVGRAKPEQGSWIQACQSSPQPPQLRPKASARQNPSSDLRGPSLADGRRETQEMWMIWGGTMVPPLE